ncbi:hypothetical protein [Microbacterium phyllosphaerae]|uniref:hypothetical protein n=1 Tax=Microbacterium phyllosphaerae TaxID=124798 RepID=UPI003D6505A8
MGEHLEEQPGLRPAEQSVRMGILTLALTVFGLVIFTAVMTAAQAVSVLSHLPDSQASLGWTLFLMMIPTVITGIVSGLTAALGAYIGRRMKPTATSALTTRGRMVVGAGLGGAIGSVPFLLYVTWWYQNGPGPWILALGYIAIFGAYAGFVALWARRRQHTA